LERNDKVIITKTISMQWTGNNRKTYEDKGYCFTKYKEYFEIKVEDLTPGNTKKIQVMCDCVDCKSKDVKNIVYSDYYNSIVNYGRYYCRKCATNERISNGVKTKLKNSISFKQWCINNNRQDILDRWDYELNNFKPDDICFSTHKKAYFKCPRGLHKSELKFINSFANGQEGSIKCKACNSFAQHLIDLYGENTLNEYWSIINITSPWNINKSSRTYVYIKCINKEENHDDYKIACSKFYTGIRCPLCNKSKGEKECKRVFDLRNVYYIPQKEFDDLLGLGGGKLSYDFYLPKYNLLVEYQGQFHDGSSGEYSKKNLKTQKEHDKRKKEYAEDNNINFLEIWYWDFDNIEEILDEYFNNHLQNK